ncbi:hypothetical protein [Streptomyces sp. WAC 06738]|uniref:hypothetical protein n=1 Tax=Streptomyces sp. WAC 06738 TaxID=2203210 RepID=UPI000F7A183F|nr:hypothetical protein [Streptomyces sp. WAC 06738]
MRRQITLTAAALVAAGAALVSTPTAAAPTAAKPEAAEIQIPERCKVLSNGKLCVRLLEEPERIQVFYQKVSGSKITARLGLKTETSRTRWDEWHSVAAGDILSQVWKSSWGCFAEGWVGVLQVEGVGTFQTPPTSC